MKVSNCKRPPCSSSPTAPSIEEMENSVFEHFEKYEDQCQSLLTHMRNYGNSHETSDTDDETNMNLAQKSALDIQQTLRDISQSSKAIQVERTRQIAHQEGIIEVKARKCYMKWITDAFDQDLDFIRAQQENEHDMKKSEEFREEEVMQILVESFEYGFELLSKEEKELLLVQAANSSNVMEISSNDANDA